MKRMMKGGQFNMVVCTLASSSSGNCTVVSHGATHILIDAGISLRRIKDGLRFFGLAPDDISCVFITHDHTDHIGGVAMLVKYFKTPLFTSFGTADGVFGVFPETEPYINCFETGAEFGFGDLTASSFPTPHDSNGSVGFTFRAGGSKLVYATDLGYVSTEVLEASLGADIAVIEANHDRDRLRNGPYPAYIKRRILSEYGHLGNTDSGDLAARLAASGSHYIQLSHLSRENNTPELAREAVNKAFIACGLAPGKDAVLDVAPPYTPGRVYDL